MGRSTQRLLRGAALCEILRAEVMTMDREKTGALIASARKERGLTQKELAAQLHVSDRAVSTWERGAGFPDVSVLEPLADALGGPGRKPGGAGDRFWAACLQRCWWALCSLPCWTGRGCFYGMSP